MRAYNGIREFKHIIVWVAVLLAFGCVNLQEIEHTLSEGGGLPLSQNAVGLFTGNGRG